MSSVDPNNYGCHSTERKRGYWASNGYVTRAERVTGADCRVLKAVWVEDTLSSVCMYDRRKQDPRCCGCDK